MTKSIKAQLLLLASLWLIIALMLAACGGAAQPAAPAEAPAADAPADAAQEKVTLVFVSYGGAYQEAQTKGWLDAYMKANPYVNIVQEEPTDYAKLKAMVESGNVTWDVVDVGNDFGLDSHKDILEPLDCNLIACKDLQPDKLLTTGYRVPDILFSTVLAYRTDKMPGGQVPQGWADFFDLEKFPGKRGVYKFAPGGVFEIALVADGVSLDKLYPLDMDRALAKLDTIKDEIVWWDTGAQSAQFLADGEVVMGMSWNGRIYNIQQEKAPVTIQWNQHILAGDYLVIPKGSKNKDEAMKLIAYITSPDHNADLSFHIPYAPPNVNAIDKVDPSKKQDMPTTYLDMSFAFDDVWWNANFDAADQKFREWLQE